MTLPLLTDYEPAIAARDFRRLDFDSNTTGRLTMWFSFPLLVAFRFHDITYVLRSGYTSDLRTALHIEGVCCPIVIHDEAEFETRFNQTLLEWGNKLC